MADAMREAAEHAYTMTAHNYAEAPVGSRDWTLYWRGWQAALAAQQPVSGRRVCCAANRCEKGGIVLGPRHWHPAMHEAAFYRFGADYHDRKWEQGFIDFDGVFLNRTEAWKVAEAAGQIVARCGGDDANGGTLYSENLG